MEIHIHSKSILEGEDVPFAKNNPPYSFKENED